MIKQQKYIKTIACSLILLTGLSFTNCSIFTKVAKNTDRSLSADLLTVVPFTTLSSGIIVLRARLNDIADTLNFL